MERFGRRALHAAVAGVAATLLITGCSGQALEGGNDSDSASGEQITLKVNFFGDMGEKMLKERFEKANPNIKITLNSAEYNAHHEDLQKKLVAGSGAPDVVAIDEGFMVQFKNQADKFVNLLDQGLGSAESRYLPWKWKASMSSDGKQIGIGTDVGGLAMCYRTDLFKEAGLPTERDQVSALWPTWDAFIETGKKYTSATKKKFIDSGTNLFNPVLGQQPVGFYNEQEQLQMEGGPKVAFDVSMKAIDAGLSANLVSFQPNWNQGFTGNKFAVLACPAWMLGHIQQTAPSTKGKWDIAAIPGGGGNWGGSWWTVPAQTKHAEAAAKFVDFATQPEQQIEVFKTVGNLPSQPALYKDQAVLDFKHEFMSGAPTGQIFAKTAESLQPQYLGKKNGKTREAVEAVITQVQQGKVKTTEAWPKAVEAANKVANS
ncbi:ABC transporter substrate-binding protein [Actinoplanes aureus]|jgi:cellobiose transport system substrate-binding protein|uniref:Extracellular solute-binding protein n=1 Tax=Actinoplanes aureus TaxID=2792083 RepID=A0A931C7L8_9ACTN|nr:extracellular solute-binding protein [Actinoplanes aureus]MBG0561968.1 extracellular solute-binding protein [Actinoplanes aureus]